ncbi:sigma-70 family RNA polymerase sigma factor [Streptomyces sp. M19]
MPTIVGEIKRFFRDTSWSVRVPRRLQELRLDLAKAGDELAQRLDRSSPCRSWPSGSASAPTRWSRDGGEQRLHRQLAGRPARGGRVRGRARGPYRLRGPRAGGHRVRRVPQPLIADLPARDRQILSLRFVANMTQSEIGEELGISQMHVSRLLSRTLVRLRKGFWSRSRPGIRRGRPEQNRQYQQHRPGGTRRPRTRTAARHTARSGRPRARPTSEGRALARARRPRTGRGDGPSPRGVELTGSSGRPWASGTGGAGTNGARHDREKSAATASLDDHATRATAAITTAASAAPASGRPDAQEPLRRHHRTHPQRRARPRPGGRLVHRRRRQMALERPVGGARWGGLSDVRVRATQAFGTVVLVAAAGAGWPWSARPPSASSGRRRSRGRVPARGGAHRGRRDRHREQRPGRLRLYADSAHDTPFRTIGLAGARGLLYDPRLSCLWALGEAQLLRYRVVGRGAATRLSLVGAVEVKDGGQDLQPAYEDANALWFTDRSGCTGWTSRP